MTDERIKEFKQELAQLLNKYDVYRLHVREMLRPTWAL